MIAAPSISNLKKILSLNPAGVSALGTSLYLISTLTLFAMWGLGLARLVGVSTNRIFRLYPTVRGTLFWFLAIQWLSVIVFSAVAPQLFLSSTEKFILLIARVLFAFTPPALMTACLYKRVLEQRSQTIIIGYLMAKEQLEIAKISVVADQSVLKQGEKVELTRYV